MRGYARICYSLLAGAAVAACDGDGGPTGPTRMEVAGVYSVCQMTFTPGGALAPVNILSAAIETTSTQVQRPELRLDSGDPVQLVYTPKGAFVDQRVQGTYSLSGNTASLRFTDSSRNAVLLPERVTLTYQASPRQLAVASSDTYTVPRADYARLSGQPETNLAPQIEGRLAATFRAGGCS